jgi:hypothetical protein
MSSSALLHVIRCALSWLDLVRAQPRAIPVRVSNRRRC